MTAEIRIAVISTAALCALLVAFSAALAIGAQVVAVVFLMLAAAAFGAAGVSLPYLIADRRNR
jgi:hypothetical protein